MIIKKFTAPTMTEALAKVRDELGTDAIILGTRSEKRGNMLNLGGRPMVEVTAAVDDNASGKGGEQSRSVTRFESANPAEARLYPPERPVAYERPVTSRATQPVPASLNVRTVGEQTSLDRLMEDVKELRRTMKVLAENALTGEMSGLPPKLAELLIRMQASGMDDKISKRLIHKLLENLTGLELTDTAAVRKRGIDFMIEGLPPVSPIDITGSKPRIVTFVGPTGSGKTTTIAKLAAEFSLNRNRNVSVLTTDTRRVDAVGQLKAYCRILNIPLMIAYTPDDLPGIMPSLMKSDLALVDTPGSGPMDKPQMTEMLEFIEKLAPQEVHIVISVTTALGEMKRIFRNFGIMKPNRILFTKLDETDSYGPLLSFAIESRKPMSYVTFGQNVPGDFSPADHVDLARRIFSIPVESHDNGQMELLRDAGEML